MIQIIKPQRAISRLVVHCSATRPSMDVGAKEIREWHVEGNGWKDIGYHFVIRRNGSIELGRPIDEAGSHAKGYNSDSIGVCLVGGVDQEDYRIAENNFTEKQFQSLIEIIVKTRKAIPHIMIMGHKDLDPKKACPSFDVREWLNKVGL